MKEKREWGEGWGRSLPLTFTSIQPNLQQHWTRTEKERPTKEKKKRGKLKNAFLKDLLSLGLSWVCMYIRRELVHDILRSAGEEEEEWSGSEIIKYFEKDVALNAAQQHRSQEDQKCV